jgi:hypothetical protein
MIFRLNRKHGADALNIWQEQPVNGAPSQLPAAHAGCAEGFNPLDVIIGAEVKNESP